MEEIAAARSAEFWESGKTCAYIGFESMQKILSPKRLQMRGLTSRNERAVQLRRDKKADFTR